MVRRVLDVFPSGTEDPDARDVLREAACRFTQDAGHTADAARRGERDVLTSEHALLSDELEPLYDDLNCGIYTGGIGRQRFLTDKRAFEDGQEGA